MENIPKRIAIVYDRVNKWGGAESVLLALHELFPTAPLYTSVYETKTASWAKAFPRVIPSFLQKIPLAKSHHELIPFLSPLAFEGFNFQAYELVISVSSADCKGIVTQPSTFHLNICLTPTRYLWSHYETYTKGFNYLIKLISQPIFTYLKKWDSIASSRPDAYIAISQTVKDRIKKYYHRDSQIVYPPVDVARFAHVNSINTSQPKASNFYLYVSRLVSYKKPDVVIKAFNQLNRPLVVVGSGNLNWGTGLLARNLHRIAKSNIQFTGFVDNQQLVDLYHRCKAVIFFHEEDFGIVAAEAQAAGKPVIGINRGGVAEIVINHKTGLLSEQDTVAALVKNIQDFEKMAFDEKMIYNNAQRFSIEQFKKQFIQNLTEEWKTYKHTYSS